MNLRDVFAKLGSERPIDATVDGARYIRLRRQNRILPARVRGDQAFWSFVSRDQSGVLSQAQKADIKNNLKNMINYIFQNKGCVDLVLDPTLQHVKEVLVVTETSGKMDGISVKCLRFKWNPSLQRFRLF